MSETREIPLTQGKVALVDAADYDFLMQWSWCADFNKKFKLWRAVRGVRINGKSRKIYMHVALLNPPKGFEPDHIDCDGLNNRRSNLRLATHQQNLCNKGRQANNTSGHKGVSWHKLAQKWRAEIAVHGRHIYLGLFSDKESAAKAYADAATKHHGEFARTESGV